MDSRYSVSHPVLFSFRNPEGGGHGGYPKPGMDPFFPCSPYSIPGRGCWSIYILNKYFLKPKAPV